jgi:hypothetical protein
MNTPQETLVRLCQEIGKNIPHWTQGAGGNISVKDGPELWIKASGLRLDQVKPDHGIACVNLEQIKKGIAPDLSISTDVEIYYSDLIGKSMRTGLGFMRPSMEAGFHAVLEKKFVFHFHSLVALLIAHEHAKDPTSVKNWFQKNTSLSASFLPSVRPGWLLSLAVYEERAHDLLILQNHGVVLQAADDQILAEWTQLEMLFCKHWNYSNLGELPQNTPIPMRIYFPDTAVFLDRLQKVLEPSSSETEPCFKLSEGAETRDQDAVELWNATQILYGACPDLSVLPEAISSVVQTLPTELIRRAKGN